MGKKRNSENQAGNDERPTESVGEQAKSAAAPRLSVTLDDHGRIDWERMRPDTRDKLRIAIGGTGPSDAPGRAKGESFPPELCEVLYDSLSMLLMGLAQRGGYTREQSGVLGFTAEDKHALVPATKKVLDKYDASLGVYQEEIMLGVLLTTIVSGKLALLKKSTQVIEMVPRKSPEMPESTVYP